MRFVGVDQESDRVGDAKLLRKRKEFQGNEVNYDEKPGVKYQVLDQLWKGHGSSSIELDERNG